jgi:hypothetical protein
VDAFDVKDDRAARRASPKKSGGTPPHSILIGWWILAGANIATVFGMLQGRV